MIKTRNIIDSNFRITIGIIILCFIIINDSFSQHTITTDWAVGISGQTPTQTPKMVIDNQGNTFLGINYSMKIKIPGLTKDFPYANHVSRLILKIDNNGKIIWSHALACEYEGTINAISLAPNGDILICGYGDGLNIFPSPNDTLKLGTPSKEGEINRIQYQFIARYSSEGNRKWAKIFTYGSSQTNGLAVNSKGEVYWSLYYNGTLLDVDKTINANKTSSNNDSKIAILKMDSMGNQLMQLPITYFKYPIAPSLQIDNQDNLIVYGSFLKKLFLSDTDSLYNESSIESSDSYIAKFDADDHFKWVRKIGGRDQQNIADLKTDCNGNIYLVGYYEYDCNISGNGKVLKKNQKESKPGDSFYYCMFHPNGDLDFFFNHQQKRYNIECSGSALAIGKDGLVYLAGNFMDTIAFDSKNKLIAKNENSSCFISVWRKDKLVSLQKTFDDTPNKNTITNMHFANNQLFISGSNFGKLNLKTTKGKKIELLKNGNLFMYHNSIN